MTKFVITRILITASMHYCPKLFMTLLLSALVSFTGTAQRKNTEADVAEALKGYFTPVSTPSAVPDAEGFIRR